MVRFLDISGQHGGQVFGRFSGFGISPVWRYISLAEQGNHHRHPGVVLNVCVTVLGPIRGDVAVDTVWTKPFEYSNILFRSAAKRPKS